jgi:hypothetical protein
MHFDSYDMNVIDTCGGSDYTNGSSLTVGYTHIMYHKNT